jgi:ABC-2 type transport system permease protein
MRTILAIAKKELTIYLTTPMAWIVFTAFSFLTSYFFIGLLAGFKDVHERMRALQVSWDQVPPDLQAFRNLTDGVIVNLWGMTMVITLFVCPFLSMRLFAEERSQKTFELLMTTPIRSIEIVLGKYLGAVGIVSCTIGLTIVYPIILNLFGASWNPATMEAKSTLEWGTVWLGYGALILFGSTCMAIGMFVSSLTDSQIVAAVVALVISLVWLLIRMIAPGADEPVRSILAYLSFDGQMQNLMKGVLELKPIVFFCSVILVFLLLTHRSVEARRWA